MWMILLEMIEYNEINEICNEEIVVKKMRVYIEW